ncbi:MAG TPA: hypothetical protein VFS21_07830 [Roseiflexaceae bacterium]|nr:hypothetical protein [Roseiflexaceae bacterium]
MWLVYLRFDDQGLVKTYHIRTGNKRDVEQIVACAEQHGLSPTAKLVEYAAFSASGTIKLKPMIAPNFHFYEHGDFLTRWSAVEGSAREGL